MIQPAVSFLLNAILSIIQAVALWQQVLIMDQWVSILTFHPKEGTRAETEQKCSELKKKKRKSEDV